MTLEHAAVRETLVKTTLKLMERAGLDGVKARLVAASSGVSVGTIYNLFGSFDGLIAAANSRIYTDLGRIGLDSAARIEREIVERGLNTPRDRVLHRLCALADTYVRFVEENSNRWNALLAFNRSRGLSGRQETSQQLAGLMDIIGALLEEVPIWRARDERRLAARALWSAVHGIVVTNFSLEEESRARTSQLLNILLTTLVDGMFARAADQPARDA